MKVWVVTYLQSYDGQIFEGVFATEEQAEAFVAKETNSIVSQQKLYGIVDYDIES